MGLVAYHNTNCSIAKLDQKSSSRSSFKYFIYRLNDRRDRNKFKPIERLGINAVLIDQRINLVKFACLCACEHLIHDPFFKAFWQISPALQKLTMSLFLFTELHFH